MSIKNPTPPDQRGKGNRSGPKDTIIVIYVCENFEECGGYYGASNMPVLEEEWNVAPVGSTNPGERTHTRARCHLCGGNRHRRYARIVPQEEVVEINRQVHSQQGTLVGDVVGLPRQSS